MHNWRVRVDTDFHGKNTDFPHEIVACLSCHCSILDAAQNALHYRLPGLPLTPALNGFNEDRHLRSPSPSSIFSHVHIKRWRLHSRPLVTMITNNFCACQWFSKSHIRQNSFDLVEFRTSFFRVLTCFNGCAAAMDARLGFGTRLRWFCDRGVWWKRTFCGKFGSGNDVDFFFFFLTGMSDVNSDSSDADSASVAMSLTATILDIQTSAILRKFVLSFVYSISLKNHMPVIPFPSERVFNSATFLPMVIPLKTLRNFSKLHLKIYSG